MALSGSLKPRFPGNQSTQIATNIDVSSLSNDKPRANLSPLTACVFRARLRTYSPGTKSSGKSFSGDRR